MVWILVTLLVVVVACREEMESPLDCARRVIADAPSAESRPDDPDALSLHLGPPNVSIPATIMASESGESLELRLIVEEHPGAPFADSADDLRRQIAEACNVSVTASVVNRGVPEVILRHGLGYVE